MKESFQEILLLFFYFLAELLDVVEVDDFKNANHW
jgi:hypothetical protein